MHELERIVLHNWGRLVSQDINVRGSVAILGPTGTGKSTIIDALQVIVTGASRRFYDLNKSTGGRNERTIRDYCLGLDSHISTEGPARDAADSLVALVFRDRATGVPITIGLIFSAHLGDAQHDLRARFVAPDLGLYLNDLIETREGGRRVVPNAPRLIERLKELCPRFRNHAGSAIGYVDDYLLAMRPSSAAPDSRQVLRNFRESIAFQPIDNPTQFVRKHILEEDDIDVEALKGSIERYRFLESEVKKREQQLEEVSEARQRMQLWARHTVRHNVLSFQIAHAERRRHDIVLERHNKKRDEIAGETEREGAMKRRHEQSIRQCEDDILRLKSVLAESSASIQLRSLDVERNAALEMQRLGRTTAQRRLTLLLRLAELARIPERVPTFLTDNLRAATDLVALARGRSAESLSAIDTELVALERQVIALADARRSLQQQDDALRDDLLQQKGRMDELEQALSASSEGAILSRPVRDFVRLLAGDGIVATALPDIVDVSEPGWAMALEMLLGANREALLVPADRLADAFSILYRERRDLHGCRLVDTRKTAQWRGSVSPTSIAAILVTDDGDARAFIERQVGRFERAETDDDLRRMERAITKRGKTTAGMGLRVYRDIQPIFGKTAQRSASESAREELAELSESYRNLAATRGTVNAVLEAIAALADEPEDTLAAALGQIADADAALRGNAIVREQVETPETRETREEIAGIEKEIRAYREEIDSEIEPHLKELREADTRIQIDIGVSLKEKAAREAEEEGYAAKEETEPLSTLIEVAEVAETIELVQTRTAVAIDMAVKDADPVTILADMVAQARRDGENLPRLADESVKRGRTLFLNFVNAYLGASPLIDDNDLAILRWCQLKERQLEEDELRQYRESFEEARVEMEKDLTEGLINRLSDKFQKARAQIERLNRNLAGRHFTGQVYAFRYHVNAAMKPIHTLAEAIADQPNVGLAMLEDDTLDPKVREGFRELERRLSDDTLVKDLQDYRQFFDFDLHMTNDRGQETTLSQRSVTGSGGQKQAPYYVAVGAAMAAAYYPKTAHGDPEGLGLVVFDEAFNNLDAPNTQALLAFFGDLHLQPVIAAPEKVRAMFLETVDTIVSVNRRPDTQEPVVTITYPKAEARQALMDANPAHRGVEAFRPLTQSAAQ
jgi:energy-coupling factor transporter ATP-binding protein EcfA2